LSSHVLPEKFSRFSQNALFRAKFTFIEAKRVKIGLSKQLQQPEKQTFFEIVFLFLVAEGPIKNV
jgi:hypothetical protein